MVGTNRVRPARAKEQPTIERRDNQTEPSTKLCLRQRPDRAKKQPNSNIHRVIPTLGYAGALDY
jgi:hypothetical protein